MKAPLKHIAVSSGLSRMIGSSVLTEQINNRGAIIATKDRELNMVKELRPQPNSITQSLNTLFTDIIGLVSPLKYGSHISFISIDNIGKKVVMIFSDNVNCEYNDIQVIANTPRCESKILPLTICFNDG